MKNNKYNKQVEVLKFKLIQKDDEFDPTIPNWSRRYEWDYAIKALERERYESIHNTCCGESNIHSIFAEKLRDKFSNNSVINSDIRISDTNKTFSNFRQLDVSTFSLKADCSLCISTIEDFQNFEMVDTILYNLVRNSKRRVIVTADYPQLSEQWVFDALQIDGIKFDKGENPLNGSNSTYPQHEFKEYNIMLLDLIIKPTKI